ncbi:hypothetical protein OHA37_13075 [Streptomyces sp. NBC_00335]|uniref:hypothetical protein n=1 Tax=unclassified Streptomyces TaxID=2593676 RepID=UPI00225AE29E|nr:MULTISPECIES: hypothetical protein [unclassified Streptomyces]MCX5404811.1 hypothetical protein [Streptomyces sp. NBC_00086]
MSQTDLPRPRRRRRPLRWAAGFLVLVAVVGYFVVQRASNDNGGVPYCTASVDGKGGTKASGQFEEMSPDQAVNAATIAAVGVSKGMPDRAVTIALATAMQESALRNLDHGDRDSLGLFQQRPSQGWGTPDQIMDPVYSAGIFYDRLAEIKGYSRLPLTVAAQKVQLSGFPQAYAKHEPDATVLTSAFTGGGHLTCTGPAPTGSGDPAKVRAELTRLLGKNPLYTLPAGAGAGAGDPASGKASGKGAGAAAESEVTLVAKPGGGDRAARTGQVLAQWAVAGSRELGITRVSYGDKSWVAGKDGDRWRAPGAAGAGNGAGNPSVAAPGQVRIFLRG